MEGEATLAKRSVRFSDLGGQILARRGSRGGVQGGEVRAEAACDLTGAGWDEGAFGVC